MSRDDLRAAALALTDEERLALAIDLAESLGPIGDPAEARRAWDDEIARRVEQLERSEVEAIPAGGVFAGARERIERSRHR
jgi:putative addiction module component (TIGR02574 family)